MSRQRTREMASFANIVGNGTIIGDEETIAV